MTRALLRPLSVFVRRASHLNTHEKVSEGGAHLRPPLHRQKAQVTSAITHLGRWRESLGPGPPMRGLSLRRPIPGRHCGYSSSASRGPTRARLLLAQDLACPRARRPERCQRPDSPAHRGWRVREGQCTRAVCTRPSENVYESPSGALLPRRRLRGHAGSCSIRFPRTSRLSLYRLSLSGR